MKNRNGLNCLWCVVLFVFLCGCAENNLHKVKSDDIAERESKHKFGLAVWSHKLVDFALRYRPDGIHLDYIRTNRCMQVRVLQSPDERAGRRYRESWAVRDGMDRVADFEDYEVSESSSQVHKEREYGAFHCGVQLLSFLQS